VEINLETDNGVLSQRFDVRVADALDNPDRRISNLSRERFKELCNIYEEEKNISAITYRTDKQSIDEVVENVLKLF
jgi:hypothetical protein